jgi:hypothetical protein
MHKIKKICAFLKSEIVKIVNVERNPPRSINRSYVGSLPLLGPGRLASDTKGRVNNVCSIVRQVSETNKQLKINAI